MEHDFVRCNSFIFFDGSKYRYGTSEEVFSRQRQYEEQGFIVDSFHDLFIRPDYGALAFCCGDCSTIDDIIQKSENFGNFYDFSQKLKKGYDFCVGPGLCYINPINQFVYHNYAVYCSNYLKVLEMEKNIYD